MNKCLWDHKSQKHKATGEEREGRDKNELELSPLTSPPFTPAWEQRRISQRPVTRKPWALL